MAVLVEAQGDLLNNIENQVCFCFYIHSSFGLWAWFIIDGILMFLTPFLFCSSRMLVGDKCSGPCAMGNRCSQNSKELAKEVKKMHDVCHHPHLDYCSDYHSFCPETLEIVCRRIWRMVNLIFFFLSSFPLFIYQSVHSNNSH